MNYAHQEEQSGTGHSFSVRDTAHPEHSIVLVISLIVHHLKRYNRKYPKSSNENNSVITMGTIILPLTLMIEKRGL